MQRACAISTRARSSLDVAFAYPRSSLETASAYVWPLLGHATTTYAAATCGDLHYMASACVTSPTWSSQVPSNAAMHTRCPV
ncbi:hypothetical protein GW17_00038723 [Ensete ventricosum]|nr:hypothetical protein GW17_00038723 [Ensete ventricosum]